MILAVSDFAIGQNFFMKTTGCSIENCYFFSIKKVHFTKKPARNGWFGMKFAC